MFCCFRLKPWSPLAPPKAGKPKAQRSSLRAVSSYELEANLMPLKATLSINNHQSKVV